MEHTPHPRLSHRGEKAHKTNDGHVGFNGWLAKVITNGVATMYCAYAFAALALVSLPAAFQGGTATLVAWIAQTFIQLVLLSIIMVGQKVSAVASDTQAEQTFKDAEALLEITDEVHKLLKTNNKQTEEIHSLIKTYGRTGKKD